MVFWSLRRIGKENLVSFEKGRVGKEAIIWVGGVVDIRLSNFPPKRGLVSEVVDVVWMIGRGKAYGGLRCGRVRIGGSGREGEW